MSGYTFRFEVETNNSPVDLYKKMRDHFSFLEEGRIDQKFGPATWPLNKSCIICFYEATKDKLSCDFLFKIFEIKPAAKITIELAKNNNLGQTVGLKHTVEIINFLINNLEGNAVVEENYRWVLSRKNGIIELDPRHSLWKPEHLAMFTFPYKIVELPQP
jgi:hypothetical protein